MRPACISADPRAARQLRHAWRGRGHRPAACTGASTKATMMNQYWVGSSRSKFSVRARRRPMVSGRMLPAKFLRSGSRAGTSRTRDARSLVGGTDPRRRGGVTTSVREPNPNAIIRLQRMRDIPLTMGRLRRHGRWRRGHCGEPQRARLLAEHALRCPRSTDTGRDRGRLDRYCARRRDALRRARRQQSPPLAGGAVRRHWRPERCECQERQRLHRVLFRPAR